ncbi:MAG: ATP-binding protein [Promethearchaeota archaeon]
MTEIKAYAIPRKRFFVEMFIRDISLKDCLLDLIDNSIDGLIRSRNIDLGEALLKNNSATRSDNRLPEIIVTFSSRRVSVRDNCGGISFEEAQQEMFNLGHSVEYYDKKSERGLGVYGVGLKRALFKIGRSFEVVSKTTKEGFRVIEDDLEDWVRRDKSLDDWSFPMEKVEKSRSLESAGTTVVVTNIRNAVKNLLDDDSFYDELYRDVARVYTFFLERFVRVKINERYVAPIEVPIGTSDEVLPAVEQMEIQNVKITLLAGLAARDQKGRWVAAQAGWYIACNGRMVTTADHTSITGWGSGVMPNFVPKYRGFVGLALFESRDPLLLPWTTTKRNLDHESSIYQIVKVRMGAMARSILTFLDSMYVGEEQEHDYEREVADRVKQAEVLQIRQMENRSFEFAKQRPVKTTTVVQYNVNKKDIQLVRKHLGRPSWSNSKVGKFTFDSYMALKRLK